MADDLPVPASHKALMRQRREAYAKGGAKTVTTAEPKRAMRQWG